MGHLGKTLILFLGLGCGTLNFTRTYDLENDREWTYPQEAPGERDRRSIDLERSGRTRSWNVNWDEREDASRGERGDDEWNGRSVNDWNARGSDRESGELELDERGWEQGKI